MNWEIHTSISFPCVLPSSNSCHTIATSYCPYKSESWRPVRAFFLISVLLWGIFLAACITFTIWKHVNPSLHWLCSLWNWVVVTRDCTPAASPACGKGRIPSELQGHKKMLVTTSIWMPSSISHASSLPQCQRKQARWVPALPFLITRSWSIS